MSDNLHEECGVFGIIGNASAAAMTALGLHALQHRGQEAAGIVSFDGEHFHATRALGHVGATFGAEEIIGQLIGTAAIGHVRYATTGQTSSRNMQPLFADLDCGGFGLAHNGNLTNAYALRRELIKRGCIFQATTDTEVILHLVALSRQKTIVDRLVDALKQVQGAYSLVCLCKDMLIGVRDPHGVRPLVIGKHNNGYVLASETCALDIIGATFVRDVKAGEVVILSGNTLESLYPFGTAKSRFCIFEYVYFARPDSFLDSHSVYEARKQIGMELAKEAPTEADIVVPVPDSGVPSALGYAQQSGIPYELGIIRSHYIGRTFIQPTDRIRHIGVKLKHNANRKLIEGKRLVLLDDSIVRGTTSIKIVEMLRAAGAKEVHMRISSPPTKHACFYGVDTPEAEKLLAHTHSIEEMQKFIGVDSLAFISIDGLYRALGEKGRNNDKPQYCDACFTGDYPIALTDFEDNSYQLELSAMAGECG
ncbi:MAG: amidophosphoribosyltransferase [Alphaproteobacteria bacterium]|nr:amidophosphoribosyltransferase [Alphaproteobacteria bacterium]